ncbi:threonine aspartase 1 isoform X1 [Malaclemys terrapin pileata]|uniref:threonine aspartase 1 isoform X1 n=1 Tax=Malaclemys terrapin pileata TaxID=2991368 RepID=UPI0023A7944C|nr:threonine aspartase 1 isoform X1 [Malaclemys terrapin pileata]XP_053879728.1 threonine aspartase 1 isoform X1 [Malaclemys terrapin pileata]
MEKGMSSVEVLPSKSSQVTAVKVMVKEHETKSIQKGKPVGFVLVHAGAGYHSESKAKEYKHVCKRACQKAIEKLQAGALATDAVTAALIELEDSPFTNAGMGSNLNLLGEIECDASIMDGKSLNFGAVGALSGIKNPVSVANRLLCEGQKGKLSAGRIPPCFLVGEGAYRWAVDHGIPACSPGIMTTRFSLAAFKRNKRKLELAEKVETDLIQLKKRRQSSEKENDSGTLDTVGAVVVDQEGNVAAAVSSGGLALKHPGRVGQAALYGCGCWAENIGVHNPYSTAVSTSGCGEHLVRTILARECSRALQTEDAHQALLETMQNKFISSPFLANEDGVLGGVIVLRSCRCSAEPDSLQEKQTLLETKMCMMVWNMDLKFGRVTRLLGVQLALIHLPIWRADPVPPVRSMMELFCDRGTPSGLPVLMSSAWSPVLSTLGKQETKFKSSRGFSCLPGQCI